MRGCRFYRSRAPVGLQRCAQNEPPPGDADPGPAVPNFDAVGARELRVVRLETFVRQPGRPATGSAQVDSQDSPRQAFARQQRVAIRVESTTVHEDRVGQIGPVLDRTISADLPYIARAFTKGPTRCPERGPLIDVQTHRRGRWLVELGVGPDGPMGAAS